MKIVEKSEVILPNDSQKPIKDILPFTKLYQKKKTNIDRAK